MKKLTAITLAAIMTVMSLSGFSVMAQTAFADIDGSHWAMASVERLVTEGTINGFEDGTFRPLAVVSRAEFVKMLGKSDVKFEKDFNDVPKDHWAYDYVMYSRLDGDANGNFNPQNAITRGEVASLLYKRYANGAKETAPNYITSQWDDANVAAWVYNTGLIVGGDMLNLRLGDTLTRAEAAVLIVRANDLNPSNKRNFIDNFSDDVYKAVYDGSGIFDTPYDANGTITYEELSAAVMRFQYKYRNPAIKYNFDILYDGAYAKYWSIAVGYALDNKGITATQEEAAKSVTVEDAISMLTLGAVNNEFFFSGAIKPDGKSYEGVTLGENKFSDNMRYAHAFGISLYADGKINPQNIITKKELSCILMQYSLSFGMHIGYSCGYDATYLPLTIRQAAGTYPANSADYAYIAEEIPNFVYEAPFMDGMVRKSRDFADYVSASAYMFSTPFMYIASDMYEKGAEIYFDMFPCLSAGYDKAGDILRVRLNVKTAYDGMKLSDMITLSDASLDRDLKAGDVIWCDIHTNQRSATTLYIDYKMLTLVNVIG